MFSELKKLSNLFIVLSIISSIFSIFTFILLNVYWSPINNLKSFFFISIYLSISIPVAFIGLAVSLRKITEEMSIKYSTLIDILRNLETKIDK